MTITAYGLGIALSAALGLAVCGVTLRRAAIPAEKILPLGLFLMPLGFLFSRLVFLLGNCTYYLTTLSSLTPALYFWDGGYAMTGAILGIVLGALAYSRTLRVPRRAVMDALSLGLSLFILIARLFERGTGLGEGREGAPLLGFFPWEGMQPVWLAEALAALLLFLYLVFRMRTSAHQSLFPRFLMLWCLSQVFLESLRDDGHLVVHFVRIQQVLCFLCVLCMLMMALHRMRKEGRPGLACGLIAAVWMLAGLGIFSEFGVDRWGAPSLAYAVMLVCLCSLGGIWLYARRNKE